MIISDRDLIVDQRVLILKPVHFTIIGLLVIAVKKCHLVTP